MTTLHRARFATRRVVQTVRCFDNPGEVLRTVAGRAEEVEYVIGDVTIVGPNVPGARAGLRGLRRGRVRRRLVHHRAA